MNTQEILTAIDAEISRLQQAREAIAGTSAPKRRGRPPQATSSLVASRKKRTLSPEARTRIAAAQRKRWAKQKAGKSLE